MGEKSSAKALIELRREYAAANAANSKYIVRVYGVCTGANDSPPCELMGEVYL